MMNPEHLANFSEAQLASALKPLLVHDNWPYFEEYLRREQNKHVTQTMRTSEHSRIHMGQGAFQEITKLLSLKQTLLMAS